MPRANQNKLIHQGFFKQDKMKNNIFAILFCIISVSVFAQDKMSKADIYFYELDYQNAIKEYQKEMASGTLKNDQLLNLADAYFKVSNYNEASKLYLKVNKNDTIISNNRFNKMLQSLSKIGEKHRVEAFLKSRSYLLSKELFENAEFNLELLTKDKDKPFEGSIFNVEGNSPQADFSPTFYKDRIVFTSGRILKTRKKYKSSGESYYDLYVSRIGSDGNIMNANTFTRVPESDYHKATPFYSEKEETLFYVLSNENNGELMYDENGKNSLALASVHNNGSFRNLLKDLSTSFYYPFFDEENDRLYFAANFDDSYGGTDLYYVHTNNGMVMSEPKNLGPRINSPGNEIAPYIFDGSLYYSSDVFYGLGGMDIYKANLGVDGDYNIPVNVGKGINSEADDFGFIVREHRNEGLMGYFSSNRVGGKGNDDIYGYHIKKSPGLETFTLKGKVVNLSSNVGVDKARIKLLNNNGDVIKELYTSPNGDYRIEIAAEDVITIQSTKDNYSIFSAVYSGKELKEIQKKKFNIGISYLGDLVQEKENKKVLKLKKFYFNRGQSTLTSAIITELKKVIEVVNRFPHIQFSIESHTDSRGGSVTNKRLSEKRSKAIEMYLFKNGLTSKNIISAVGYGEEQITNSCTNGAYCLDFLHKQNERTYFVLLNYEE